MMKHQSYRRKFVPPYITPPPSQDAPNHILNALSDECIQRVLGYLIGNIRDFLNAAEVCRKFQENAKICYPSIYRDFDIGTGSLENLPMYRIKDFLCIFGHLIRSMHWEPSRYGEEYEAEIFRAIAEFCGKTLLGLRIRERNLNFKIGNRFEVLEELQLLDCNVVNFKPPPSLKKLYQTNELKVDNFTWMSEAYPNLIGIEFADCNGLNDDILVKFQELNPQLTFFSVRSCENLTSSVLQGISSRLPNLTGLQLCFKFEDNDEVSQRKLKQDVMHLSGLRHLKLLHGTHPKHHNISDSGIIESLAENNAPIEDLCINGFHPGIVESLLKFKHMRKLDLCYFSASAVVHLVKELPNLEHVELRNPFNTFTGPRMSLNEVVQILEYGKNLKFVHIYDSDMKLDSDILLNSISNLAGDRVRVQLSVSKSNVPESFKQFKGFMIAHCQATYLYVTGKRDYLP